MNRAVAFYMHTFDWEGKVHIHTLYMYTPLAGGIGNCLPYIQYMIVELLTAFCPHMNK